jgi:hypothetical protein
MKKIIIAAALVLTSAVTAFSLTISNNTNAAEDAKIQQDAITTSVKNTAAPKSDIATAD